MKWVAISGSWRYCTPEIECGVRRVVREIIRYDDGIICGGAPGVDYVATDEAMSLNPTFDHIKVILPTSLKFYIKHNRGRMEQGKVPKDIGDALINQLEKINKVNYRSIIENVDLPRELYVKEEQYFNRNTQIIELADELVAFHVNGTKGTQDAIKKAGQKKIPVKVFSYEV